MSFRYMRTIIFFDLSTITPQDRKDYLRFRKLLINEGFIMMQESVYSKLALNASAMELINNKIKKGKPKGGIVQMLTITEKQFSSIDYLVGKGTSYILDSTTRLIIL